MICALCDKPITDIVSIPCVPDYLKHDCKMPHAFHEKCYLRILMKYGEKGFWYTYCPLPIKDEFREHND